MTTHVKVLFSDKLSFVVLVLFATVYPITLGLYFYDFIAIVSLVLSALTIGVKITRYDSDYLFALTFLVLAPNILFFLYQLFSGTPLTVGNFYIVYNVILSIVYLLFVRNVALKFVLRYLNLTTFLFLTPLLISSAMFFLPNVSAKLMSIYGVEKVHYLRFGGVWGSDVNQLGYYAAVVLVWSSFLLAYRKINIVYYGAIFLVCLSLTLLSGMRTGLVVFFASFILVSFFSKKYRKALSFNAGILVLMSFFIAFLVSTSLNIVDFDVIFDRFSFELFVDQLTGQSGDGHIGNMYEKWFLIYSNEQNIWNILFSFNSAWKFPDSFVIYYFSNCGLVGVFLLVVFVGICFLMIVKSGNYAGLMVLALLFAVSFKGNYPVNNMSMFIFTLIFVLESHLKRELEASAASDGKICF
jgi:hypothetical protein